MTAAAPAAPPTTTERRSRRARAAARDDDHDDGEVVRAHLRACGCSPPPAAATPDSDGTPDAEELLTLLHEIAVHRPLVSRVIRDHAGALLADPQLAEQVRRVLRHLVSCRTEGLGGHLVRCESCGQKELVYHACRDRHCPTCPAVRALRWVEVRKQRALDVEHHHAVFTLPGALRPLFFKNQDRLYGEFMKAVADAVRWGCRRVIGDATPAFTTVLHTWDRRLKFHLHAHVVLAVGGLSLDGSTWVIRGRGECFLPADEALRERFRDALLARVQKLRAAGQLVLPPACSDADLDAILARQAKRRWHVYSKKTLRSDRAYEYLGRYARRVGLSSARIVAYDGERVTFVTKGGKTTTITGAELVRRLALHVLPRGFVRLRHYGLFTVRHKARLALARQRIAEQGLGCGYAAVLEGDDEQSADLAEDAAWQDVVRERLGFDPDVCRACKARALVRVPIAPSPLLVRRDLERVMRRRRAPP